MSTMPQQRVRLTEARKLRGWSQKELAELLGTTQVNVSRWERGLTTPTPYFRVKLYALFGKNAEELGFVPESPRPTTVTETEADPSVESALLSPSLKFPALWSVPYPRNPFFTGREALLHTLHEKFSREHSLALTQSWAISGLGGIGKTQIALEYAYHYRHDYSAVFWISAATRETLQAGLVTIAAILQIPEKDEHDQHQVIEAVKKWLATHQGWLLILDNADDVTMVHDVLSMERGGHLLLTTRAQALGPVAQRIEVETMGMAEGTLFLLRRAKLLDPLAFLDQASPEQLAAAEAIVIAMDFLPLALDQAGAYIEEVGCSLTTYVELYHAHRAELLHRRGHVPGDHPEPVATTWSLNFRQVEQARPAAAELLRLCAFLEPDMIPEELISKGGAGLGPLFQQMATDAFALNEAIEQLRKFSLVQRDPETRVLRLHRLVQAVLQDALGQEERRQWARQAVCATSKAFPDVIEDPTWSRDQRFLPQAQVCSALIQEYALVFAEAGQLLFQTAHLLMEYGLSEQAEPLYQQALHIWEQVYGSEHPKVADSLCQLAVLANRQGKYEHVELLYQRALHIREQTYGPEHPDVAHSLNNLGNLYLRQSKLEQAEVVCRRALQIRKQTLGPAHSDVARSLINLANISKERGKFEQAEVLYKQTLQIWEQTYGPEHPAVAKPLHNLAEIYNQQGRDEQAEALFQRVLSIWEQAYGPENPSTAHTLVGLADLYVKQRKYEQAEGLYQRALHICEQVYGPEHPNVAFPLTGLASLYAEQGKDTEAEPLYQQALHICEQALGSEHPDLAHPLIGLANLYSKGGMDQQAEVLYQRASSLQI